MTGKTLDNFKDSYQHSEEERLDVLAAYKAASGDVDKIFRQVMLSNALDDEERFRGYIDQAIKDGELEALGAYIGESVKKKERRHKDAKREGKEAKEHAKKIGVYDQLFGDENGVTGKKGSKKANKKESHDSLAGLIQQRQKARDGNFLDELEAKFAPKGKGATNGKSGKKRKNEEPPEELFQKNGQQKKGKVSNAEDEGEHEEEVDLEADFEAEAEEEAEEEEEEEEVKPAKSKSKGTRSSGRGSRKKSSA